MIRLALYGGSFDPIHHGHLILARQALEDLSLDRIVFVPAAESPFKPNQSSA
ncbi:MAG: adenylyltransferase/cytidyltransferase family protein, partial [Verrucomicrobia bacterium]|nr:adenylyltransferase/cytidyltransferase family protein [Verrucomicrobiota bacterium]